MSNYTRLERETGGLRPGQHGGHRKSRLMGFDDVILGWIKAEPELTLDTLCQRIKKKLGIQIKKTALDYRLKKLGYSFKKNAQGRRTRATGHPETPSGVAEPTA